MEYFVLFITPEIADHEHRNKLACPTIYRQYDNLQKKI
jgi:hypothetical protein